MIRNLCKFISLAAFILIIVWPHTAFAASAKITACDPCGLFGAKHAAKSLFNWNQGGVVFVADFDNQIGYKFNVYIDYIIEGPDQFPIHKASQLSLSSAENAAFSDLFDLYHALKIPGGELIIDTENFTYSLGRESYTEFSTTSSGVNLGRIVYYITPHGYANDSAFDAYGFMSNSQLRNQLYSNHLYSFSGLITTVFNGVTNAFNLGALNLKDINFSYEIRFPNGSSIVAYPDPQQSTLRYVDGSAKDPDGNSIPSPYSANITGSYNFSSPENYENMMDYFNMHFGAQFPDPYRHCNSISTTCYWANQNHRICIIDQCFL